MAILPITTLETAAAGTLNPGGIIKDNWLKLEKLFDPALSAADPLYGVIYKAVTGQGGGITTITYAASVNVDIGETSLNHLLAITGNVTIAVTNKAAGRDRRLVIVGDASARTLTWPVGAVWSGAPTTALAANEVAVIDILSRTTLDAGLVLARVGAPAAASTLYADKVAAMAPVGYWKMGETSGTTFADSAGANPGTSTGTPTLNNSQAIKGNTGRAPLFDGVDDLITVPDNAALEYTPGTDPWSVSLWAKHTSADTRALIAKTGGGADRHFHLFNGLGTGIGLYTGAGFTTHPAAGFNNGLWHHVCVSMTAALATLYFDGSEIGTQVHIGTQVEPALDWMIGARRTGGANVNTGATNRWLGNLAHVAIFNRALTAVEVGRLSENKDF